LIASSIPGKADFRPKAAYLARVLLIGLVVILCTARPSMSWAQSEAEPASTVSEDEKLVQETTDPLTTLPQVSIRESYVPANYGPCTSGPCFRDVVTNQLIVRPLIPRVPPNTLLPIPQLVRPTFALLTTQSSRGGTRTEFGDLPIFDVAVSPWPKKETGLLWGIGPSFVFPTATSKSAGQGAWQAGPTLGAVYKGIPRLLLGIVIQNPVSFAYTSPSRPSQNTLLIQPVFAFYLWDKWYLRSAEATWTLGWRRHSQTNLPISLGLGRSLVIHGLPPMSLFVTGEWTVYRQFSPLSPQTTINFGITIAFPQFRKIWGS